MFTMNTSCIFTGRKEVAQYNPSEEPMYRHNAFIEALPPVYSAEQIGSLLRRTPFYNEGERLQPIHQRLQAVQRIAHFLEPLPRYITLEQAFSRMIRSGYLTRNPISAEWIKQIRSGFPNLDWGNSIPGYTPKIRQNSLSFSIIGTSGVGKTTAVESVLSLYPQVIIHTEYSGHSFNQAQLVWLKLECPQDGSLRGLCLNFFQGFDYLFDTRFYKERSRRTVNELLPDMAQFAANCGLGLLVIDEIQRLHEAKSGGAEKMLNFFVELSNTIGVPVVLVGTYKALPFLNREFAMARRSAGQGDLIWSNEKKNEIWDYLMSRVWKYQWTSLNTPLTQELKDVFYEESQGIIDIAIKLYMLAQWAVIGTDNEAITPLVIKERARENLKLAKPILDALRSGDESKLREIKDVGPMVGDLDKYFDQAVQRVTISGVLNTLGNQQKSSGFENEESPCFVIAKWLVEVGIETKIAINCAEEVLKRYPNDADLKAAKRAAYELAMNSDPEEVKETIKQPPKCKAKQKVITFPGDLRTIVQQGKDKGKSGYESLKAAGYIKSAKEFL